ncbi:MAG: ABC transporter ATP-binding protein [Rhodobacteraceae bacterium]|nr:ABC transporter ATP-binding protein [Paracoccaceae bacterium]MYE37001.1 ABC transporter ATP-binding protein [Paracoccaceae bacterium]MYF47331.1 ABC transporter ATP-binding protein [Paracoccaceae bacterium]MYI90933.1 ABC transporter ATP-binding protein [Paracoccaceae bacterium]
MAPISHLSTKGLSKNFGGIQAIRNVDFDISKGQIRALIGPNGAGKSTFVGMISGRIPPTTGEIYFADQNITSLPAHKRICLGIAYTFQITSVFSKLTVHENVALAVRRNRQLKPNDVLEQVSSILDKVGLLDRANSEVRELSYGHQRLLEIAMGLGQEPSLFILDEPTQGLAESEVLEFITILKSMAGLTTILLIEHNMDVVMATAEFITVMNFGEILAEGTPDQIRLNEEVQLAYLGKT